ncbi:head decoration protein [Candidatus Thiothrix sp. Deng01]|uniref:Head decoration protein n=1 Tax=Candidatus Thiothrix phosphatis TaxID=3112415 RepID=A0ABU6CT95_9GAMM|nr:head decoration protein [Candidatus Thiothrix sp. Deng01]MEB4590019.1 head decoration protein [Candidatus Thiothrix sp. Deng01]
MPVIDTLGKRQSDVIRYEEPTALYSRDTATAGSAIALGQMLTIANGTATVTPAAGTPNAVAIYDAANGEKVTVLARHAIVNESGLVYPVGATAEQKNAMNAAIAEVGILVRV